METTEKLVKSFCSVVNLKKNFGGVQALKGVDLSILPGSIHAVVGENGAGKSTLMKILAGAIQSDEGEIFLNDEKVKFKSVLEANKHGIAIVFQELSLFPHLDILANLFLRREDTRFGLVDRSLMYKKAAPILQALELDIDLDTAVKNLSIGERQLIEIAKALLLDSKVLILDEPNSALNNHESERLFNIIKKLRKQGISIIYVSHRLEEVFDISDCVTVMRDGKVVADLEIKDTSIQEVVALMLGRDSSEFYKDENKDKIDIGKDSIELRNVSVEGELNDVSIKAYSGEVVGLIGLEGAGVQTIFDILFGIRTPDSGEVLHTGNMVLGNTISERVRGGMAYIPNDRKNLGLMLHQSIFDNVSLVSAGVKKEFGFFQNVKEMLRRCERQVKKLAIVAPNTDVKTFNLSGGNQQKVLIGKWLESEPEVILLNDPTRGVDIGAKEDIYGLIRSLIGEGKTVIMSSSEIPEYIHLCDRVYVLYRGSVCGEIYKKNLDENRLVESINTGVINSK